MLVTFQLVCILSHLAKSKFTCACCFQSHPYLSKLIAGPDVKHPAGHHIYPFSMSLPTSVPSSFEGRRGYVRYQCMAFVDRGWKGMLDCIQDFTVIHHLDLNTLHNVAVSEFLKGSLQI